MIYVSHYYGNSFPKTLQTLGIQESQHFLLFKMDTGQDTFKTANRSGGKENKNTPKLNH